MTSLTRGAVWVEGNVHGTVAAVAGRGCGGGGDGRAEVVHLHKAVVAPQLGLAEKSDPVPDGETNTDEENEQDEDDDEVLPPLEPALLRLLELCLVDLVQLGDVVGLDAEVLTVGGGHLDQLAGGRGGRRHLGRGAEHGAEDEFR